MCIFPSSLNICQLKNEIKEVFQLKKFDFHSTFTFNAYYERFKVDSPPSIHNFGATLTCFSLSASFTCYAGHILDNDTDALPSNREYFTAAELIWLRTRHIEISPEVVL